MNLSELHYIGKMLMDCAVSGMQRPHGMALTATELVVVECLQTFGTASIGEIAQRTGYAQSRISRVVTDLEGRDLVSIAIDTRDRRRTIVAITETSCVEEARIGAAGALPVLSTWFPHLDDRQLEDLMTVLARIIAPVQEIPTPLD